MLAEESIRSENMSGLLKPPDESTLSGPAASVPAEIHVKLDNSIEDSGLTGSKELRRVKNPYGHSD